MKFLCLAYGNEDDWNELSTTVQNGLLAQDEILRKRGDVVAAVDDDAITVRAWDGAPNTKKGAVTDASPSLAGFYIVDAENLDEAVHLIHDTPCARAKGAIVVHEITEINGA